MTPRRAHDERNAVRQRMAHLLLVSLLILSIAACGSSDVRSEPGLTVDGRLGSALGWSNPTVSREQGDGYVARLSPGPGAGPLSVRLTGLGFPGGGVIKGQRFVGPGLIQPWTSQIHGQYKASIGHKGSRLSLVVWSRGGTWRAEADGDLIRTAPLPAGRDYSMHTLDVDFSSAEIKRRTITFELGNGAWLAGVRTGPKDEVWLPKRRPSGPRIYWMGDSFLTGTGARFPGFGDFAHVASSRLKLTDVATDALGGTGYVKANTAAHFPNFADRVKRNLISHKATADVVVIAGSINDLGVPADQLRASARSMYVSLRRAMPKTRIVVVPFSPRYPAPASVQTLSRTLSQAASGLPNVFVEDLPGEVWAKYGPSRAPALQRPDGHPTEEGHEAYGRLIAAFISKRRLLKR